MRSLVTLLMLCCHWCQGWEGQIVFREDFEGEFLRKHYWDYEEGCEGKGKGDSNLECFKKGTNNVEVRNGTLVITAHPETTKDYKMGKYKEEKMHYTSGKIIQSGFGFSHGTYVVRARLPKGNHLLPSISLLPMGQREETCLYEEIELLLGRGQRPSTLSVGAHFGKNYVSLASKSKEKVFRDKDFSRDFHEFALKWTPTRLEWFVDNEKMFEAATHFVSDWITNRGDNRPTCSVGKLPFSQRSVLVLSLSVGGTKFPEAKYGRLTPQEAHAWPKPTFEIDSIKVYDPKLTPHKEKFSVFNIPGLDGLDITDS